MHKVFEFIKETYLLQKKSIELIQCHKLFEDFQNYTNNTFEIEKSAFYEKIRELFYYKNEKKNYIKTIFKNKKLYFICSYDDLLAIFINKSLYNPLIENVIEYILNNKLETNMNTQEIEFKSNLIKKDKQIKELIQQFKNLKYNLLMVILISWMLMILI